MPLRTGAKASTKVGTIVGRGTMVEGDIHSKGSLRVEGDIRGTVQCDDTIVVQDGARVEAELRGRNVIVSGQVTGNVHAEDGIELAGRARVIGDLHAARIVIAEGVVFEGRCVMPTATRSPGRRDAAADGSKPAESVPATSV